MMSGVSPRIEGFTCKKSCSANALTSINKTTSNPLIACYLYFHSKPILLLYFPDILSHYHILQSAFATQTLYTLSSINSKQNASQNSPSEPFYRLGHGPPLRHREFRRYHPRHGDKCVRKRRRPFDHGAEELAGGRRLQTRLGRGQTLYQHLRG